MREDPEITLLLGRWSAGDALAAEQLAPLIYDELRSLARRIFSSERAGHTLQPTALVNEAFVRLIDVDVAWNDRAHFFALAARMMRRLLINHANARKAERRGGDPLRLTLEDVAVPDTRADVVACVLTDALDALEAYDARKSQLIEMQYFGGLSTKEMAEVTGLSVATVGRELRFARAWLKNNMAG